MKSIHLLSRFGLPLFTWSVLFSSVLLSGCLEDSKSTNPSPTPTNSNPPPQIGSPFQPIGSNPNLNQEEGLLKVLATPATSTIPSVAMKTKGSDSRDHCTDSKRKDDDKDKHCQDDDSRGPDSNHQGPGNEQGGGNINGPKNGNGGKDSGTITAINLIIREVSAHSDTLDWRRRFPEGPFPPIHRSSGDLYQRSTDGPLHNAYGATLAIAV